jgi:hypothetical protein
VQVVRADLDGDGTDEVIVVVERLSDPQGLLATDGDYSVAFVRQLVNGDVHTAVLSRSIASITPGATRYILVARVAAVADLNGDGRMELALQQVYYEGSGTQVFEVQPGTGRLVDILGGGCGV